MGSRVVDSVPNSRERDPLLDEGEVDNVPELLRECESFIAREGLVG